MDKMRDKMPKRIISVICALCLVAAVCAALTACDDASSSPLPTDAEWVFYSLTVTENDTVTTYYASLGGRYDDMEVNEDMVTVDFTENRIVLTFINGDEIVGGWKKSGEAGGASLIEYDFVGESQTYYGTCGRTRAADGTEQYVLYVVCDNLTFYFTGSGM